MKEKYTVPALEIISAPVNTFLAVSSDSDFEDNWGYSDVFKP